MADDELRYDRMVEDALRSVVGRALSHIAERGLPGDHHFYITFQTDHPEVVMPDHLRARYPSEMTIVLQHQFWGLEVGRDAFGVTLSFANVPERLTVPFESVVAFADVGSDEQKGREEDTSFAITALEDLLEEWRFLEAHPDVEGEVEDDRRVMWTTDNVEIAEKYGFEAWPPSDC